MEIAFTETDRVHEQHEHDNQEEYVKPTVVSLKSLEDNLPEAKGKVNSVLQGVGAGLAGAAVGAALLKGYH